MKAIKLVLIIFLSALVINFIRNGRTFHIAKSLPFSNATDEVGIYDWACVAKAYKSLLGDNSKVKACLKKSAAAAKKRNE